ncbi:MAG TPA: phosphoribosylamine--glycine ligase [Pyrinomonadaceae bacterium]|nr:phosphoribosylamine--glycine ligase [Pyrinomonadaceae bacterium]
MKILIIGSGGREHALCRAFNSSKNVGKIYCAEGNAGIAQIAECVNIKPDQIEHLAGFAEENRIDLTFVGGETSLALGIVDEFEKRNLKIVGASEKAARLEASKAFAKDFMARHNIPTAVYETANSPVEAVEILKSGKFGDAQTAVVVKADGLAAGKGVVVAENHAQAELAIKELDDLAGKTAAAKIVLEECLTGREVSLLLFADGKNFALMPSARDHKRVGENDTGANTGGMGVITDAALLTVEQTAEIVEKIIKPTLDGARQDGFEFRGVLFLGLMLTRKGIKVLEYNVRFGDPETQAILVRLETDFVEICEAILNQALDKIVIEWKKGSSACVILASGGYPRKPQTGKIINGFQAAESEESIFIFHGATVKNETGEFITSGGRVLGVTATAENLSDALQAAYRAVDKISFEGMHYRRDIGK